MTLKLNQIVAVVNGKKTELKKELTELHRKSSTADLFAGLTKTYQPLEEDGETYPDDNKAVQLTVGESINKAADLIGSVMDAVATQDYANTQARASVTVDGTVVLDNVPVTYLMYLEKQLQDVETFVQALPVLDIAQRWNFDQNQGLYVSEPTKAQRTKKVLKHKVLYEATKEHPAQIEKWNEDVAVGIWTTQKFSGAMSQVDKAKALKRIKDLQEAVKYAREAANAISIEQVKVGEKIFDYLFK
jgi:hypothetical protein